MTTGKVPPAVSLKLSVSLPGSKQWEQVLLKETGQLLCAGRMRIQEDNSSGATASVRAVGGPGERQSVLEAPSLNYRVHEKDPSGSGLGVTGITWHLGRSTLIPGVTNSSCQPLQPRVYIKAPAPLASSVKFLQVRE